jgi:hypothetical protein
LRRKVQKGGKRRITGSRSVSYSGLRLARSG